MIEIQAKMMKKLQQHKKKLLGIAGLPYFDTKQIMFLESVYGKSSKSSVISGKDAARIVQKLQRAKQDSEARESTTRRQF